MEKSYILKFESKEAAFHQAKMLSLTFDYVIVIQSHGCFYVETEALLIRSWEREILFYSYGKKIFGDEK